MLNRIKYFDAAFSEQCFNWKFKCACYTLTRYTLVAFDNSEAAGNVFIAELYKWSVYMRC
jgi:hypothetical protein